MPVHDELGKRMKEYYEAIPKTKLMRRTPVAIRIDGKAFHTFTRGFKKPFDRLLMNTMQATMKYLCENIQGCVFGYTQSDEITLILCDYQTLTTAAWFDYNVQKICSIAASMATMAFNKFFAKEVDEFGYYQDDDPIFEVYQKALEMGAMFDARCFNIPKEEVANLIYWRQLDATRNSIQMVGQANFSHRQLEGKSCNDIQNMLLTEKNINWNDYLVDCKRGAACRRVESVVQKNVSLITGDIVEVMGKAWEIDHNMPILKDDWDYINREIRFDD